MFKLAIPRTAVGTIATIPETLYDMSDQAWADGHKIKSVAEIGLGLTIDAACMFGIELGVAVICAAAMTKIQSLTGR